MSQTKFTPGEWIAKKYAGPYPEMWVETNEEPIAKVENAGDLPLLGASKAMYEALTIISEWKDFPDTGRFWDNEGKEPMSYSACYGSNGERDFMRGIADKVLAKARGEQTTQT